jgi:transcriptional regulator with XRE-family HTH domain
MSKIWNPKASEVTPDEIAIIEEEERLVYETQKAVRALLRARNQTAADLADLLGVSAARVSQMMNGNANLTLRTIARIYKVLGTRAAVCEASETRAVGTTDQTTAPEAREVALAAYDRAASAYWTGIAQYDEDAIDADAEYGTKTVWIVGEPGLPTIPAPSLMRRRKNSPSSILAKLPPFEPFQARYEQSQKVLIDA